MDNITDVILNNEGLIYKIISKYKKYFDLDDLYQVAVMGMIKAYKKYDASYGTKFTSYAYPYMLGEVIKYINEFRGIKRNKEMTALYQKIVKAMEILSQKIMKTPSIYELSLFLEIDEHLIEKVLETNVAIDSLDRIISEDGKNLELYDKCGYIDQTLENYPLTSEIDKLSNNDRQIIMARYYDDMSQSETGKKLGMYQVEVSRREKKILQILKDRIAA